MAWDGYCPQQSTLDDGFPKSGGFRRGRDFKTGELERIDFSGQKLVPVRKDFAYMHPTVRNRNEDECNAIRLRWGIEVSCSREDMRLPKPVTTFEEAPFPDWAADVLRGHRLWREPTPIQVQGWPAALSGFDVIGIASTGSGKTMAYILPMLVHVIAQPELKPGEGPVGLVLLPTRELCGQVRDEIATFAVETDLRCESIYGGEDVNSQEARMLERVDIVTATPGRLISLLQHKKTNLLRVTFVVIDEADDLLDQRFEEQTLKVLSQVRPDRQVLLFSATYQDNVKVFAEKACEEKGRWGAKGTIQINVGGIKLSACKDIDQQFWLQGQGLWEPTESKEQALCKALGLIKQTMQSSDSKVLVFCNRLETIGSVVAAIRQEGWICEGFDGDLEPEARERILKRFKAYDSDLRLLVCTSVLGRGHDFHNVRYVVNYDMPTRLVDYIHRIGRTGRRGEEGYALTLLEHHDLRFAKDIELCLKESKRHVPQQIAIAARSAWRYHQEYRNLRYGTTNVDGEARGGSVTWSGRGRGRRELYLQELGGRGASRGVPLADA